MATIHHVFFFKQKTAYEIGLGIPAEPLFRSFLLFQNLFQELDAVIHLLMEAKHWGLRKSRNATSLNSRFKSLDTLRSEERRVGKGCRWRWWAVLQRKGCSRGLRSIACNTGSR